MRKIPGKKNDQLIISMKRSASGYLTKHINGGAFNNEIVLLSDTFYPHGSYFNIVDVF